MQPIPPSNDKNDIQVNKWTGNMRIGASADVNALLRALVEGKRRGRFDLLGQRNEEYDD